MRLSLVAVSSGTLLATIQLLPENFEKSARDVGLGEGQVKVRSQADYDHSYYFISTFIEEHVEFHKQAL